METSASDVATPMSAGRNAPPKTGWAKMVAELHVNDLNASLAFWKDIIGFEISYSRQEEKFAYLEHPEGQQIMLCQRDGRFETGPMQHPLGQGAMFQIYFKRIDPVMSKLSGLNWPIYLEPRDVWRRTGDRESGQREVFVQDPDGYLLMLAHNIGERVLGTDAQEGRMNHSDDVSVRRFQEADLCQLVRLISETIGISYAEVYPPRAVQFFKDFHSETKIADRSKTGTTLVIEEDGELVATGSLVGGEILAVFVHPRMQQGGRGKALMKALENEARATGVTEIGLSISLPSKRFYESLGYKVVEERSRDVGEGQRLDFWKAAKQLSNS